MRLIDADALLENNPDFADRDFIHPMYDTTLRDIVDDAPTIDAVEVVRCGECKWFIGVGHYCKYCREKIKRTDGYCSYGERRDNNG